MSEERENDEEESSGRDEVAGSRAYRPADSQAMRANHMPNAPAFFPRVSPVKRYGYRKTSSPTERRRKGRS